MLVQLYRISLGGRQAYFSSSNISKVYFRRFQQLIRSEDSYKKTVEEYARDLFISTGHLSRICRSIAGKSPKDILIDYFITKAQLALSDVDSKNVFGNGTRAPLLKKKNYCLCILIAYGDNLLQARQILQMRKRSFV